MKRLLAIVPFEYDVNQILPNNYGLARKLCEVIEKYNMLLDYINLPEAEYIAQPDVIDAEIIEDPKEIENIDKEISCH